MSVITLPNSLDLESAVALSTNLSALQEDSNFTIDFSRIGYVEPFGMLVAAAEIRRLINRFPLAKYTPDKYQHLSYAGHMGFFQAFGVKFGKAPGQAKGNDKYVPLTILNCDSLRKAALEKGTEIGDEIEEQSKHLAQVLCGAEAGAIFDTLSYSIRELMRNVVEHSSAPEIWFCAQYWPTKNKMEVAIVDQGIGLRKSLSTNPHLDASDDKRAINYALMPAVSGKAFKGARNKQRGPWANSGFGLYMTSRICRNGGTFFICSGNTGMLLTKKSEAKRYFSSRYQGTAIRMVIRTNQLSELTEALALYRSEGFQIQKRYSEIVNIDPSSASLMLSEDFDLSVWDRLLAKLKG